MDKDNGEYAPGVLEFTIHKCSTYSEDKRPDNILCDDPTNEESRWFTNSEEPDQYIILKLNKPAIVDTIVIGKFIKPHQTNLKKFHIYGGCDENKMQLLLKAGLKQDSMQESFNLRYCTSDGYFLPIEYLKIVPLQSWGSTNHYSLWYVALHGRNQDKLVQNALQTMHLRKEQETIRIILRYLRRRQYNDAFTSLCQQTGVQLEGPVQARFWNALVEEANFEEAENIFVEAANEGELEWYLSWQKYRPQWQQIYACSPEIETKLIKTIGPHPAPLPSSHMQPVGAVVELIVDVPIPFPLVYNVHLPRMIRRAIDDLEIMQPKAPMQLENIEPLVEHCSCRPGPRGGHQVVIDPEDNKLYLYAGWSGTRDLDDLWMYDVITSKWAMLCAHSGNVSGPSPRSCHKVIIDTVNKKLYTLGRYLDASKREPSVMKNDFYVYDLSLNRWNLISEDVSTEGGPGLLYDHQMCIDTETQIIYLFGGRLLPTNIREECHRYSGLYAYNITTNKWQLLMKEPQTNDALIPRIGHSMVFHPIQKRLYIFSGTANKELLMGLWWWDVRNGESGVMSESKSGWQSPVAAFTQRATIDPQTNEMFVLSGMTKEREKRVSNTMWAFSLTRLTWNCVYQSDMYSAKDPRPRFGHQLVYDHIRKVHYLFGGNPGHELCAKQRLDDLWSLQLHKTTISEVKNRARALLREARYKQLAEDANEERALEALDYLRHNVHEVFDHSDPEQVQHFHRLASVLFAKPECVSSIPRPLSPGLTLDLAQRKVRSGAQTATDLSHTLDAILTEEDIIPEIPESFEYIPESQTHISPPVTPEPTSPSHSARERRMQVYDTLCQYFKPSLVPPKADISELVDI